MNPTASALDRVLNCPASHALPQVRQQSDAADFGQGVHAFKRRADAIGRDAALLEVPEDAPHRAMCEQLPLDELPKGGRAEVAFARNRRTGAVRVLGEGEHRDYSDVTDDEDCGTADLVGTKNGRGIVKDWKTGRYVGKPGEAAQLLFFALCLAEIDDTIEDVEVAFCYLRDDGTFFEDRAVVDRFDLAAFAGKLRALPARIQAERDKIEAGRAPDVNNGPWCRHCPATASCPAKTALAKSFGGELVTIRDKVSALSAADAGKVYAKALEYKDILDEVIAGLKDVARVHPLELPDGRQLREVEWKLPTKVDADVAEQVLTELHGEKVAKAAIETEKRTTLTAIENALRPLGKLAPLKRAVLDEMRKRRGLVEGTAPSVRIVKKESA